MNPNHLNLYVVDDDEPTRKALLALLGSSDKLNHFSIRMFESGESFLAGASTDTSGVVVLDLDMGPGKLRGLEVQEALNRQKSPLVVVFLSGVGDIPDAVRGMQAGAFSWLSKLAKNINAELLTVLTGAAEKAKEIAIERRDRFEGRKKWETLSLREMQVSALSASGKTSKEVADTLTRLHPMFPINYRTVENHRARAYAKLEVATSNELLIFLQQNDMWDEAQASLIRTPGKGDD